MATIKLGELPSIKQAVSPVNSGEVKEISGGGLALPDIGAPVLGTDAANKDYVDSVTTIYTEVSADFDNAVAGNQTLVTITDAPILMTLSYNATTGILQIDNTNAFLSGIDFRVNYFIKTSSELSGEPEVNETPANLPGSYVVIGAATAAEVGTVFLSDIDDRQEVIIQVNEPTTSPSTYSFFITLFRNWAGVTVDIKYRFSDLP